MNRTILGPTGPFLLTCLLIACNVIETHNRENIMKITVLVNGNPETVVALDIHEDVVGNWVICYPTSNPKQRLFLPVTDIVEIRKTYFGFDGTIEFVLPEDVPLKVGDYAKATFYWPGRIFFPEIDYCEDYVDHIVEQGTTERHFFEMREFEKEYRMIKLEVWQNDGTMLTVYDDSTPPLSL